MATRYTLIRSKLLEKLQTVTKLQQVLDYPVEEFTGYPAAFFIPAEGEGEWVTNAEDERSYTFDIHIYYDIEPGGISNAIAALFDCIDDVLDVFAQDKHLSDTGTSLQTLLTSNGYTSDTMVTTQPVSAAWEQDSEKKILRAVVKLQVRLNVSNL